MVRNSLLLGLILSLSFHNGVCQSGSITGLVTDSLTGKPIPNVSVFFPFTSTGTTTHADGTYTIENLASGNYTLMFRHVAYQTYSRHIIMKYGDKVIVNLAAAESVYPINEVVKRGRIADPKVGNELIKKYFLGDSYGSSCILENPEVLEYYYDGDVFTANAREPLTILNRHLGYRITYYLDYFKYVDSDKPARNAHKAPYYSFSGSALYQDLSSEMPQKTFDWKINRKSEFTGSLKHFFACLYEEQLKDEGYSVRKAYLDLNDLQAQEKISKAVAKVRYVMLDSIFFWNPTAEKPEYVKYFPNDPYPIGPGNCKPAPEPGVKLLMVHPHVLIFKDSEKTPDLRDDWTYSIQLPDSVVAFDREGNYGTLSRDLIKTNLNQRVRIRVLLPLDYLPKTAEKNR